MSRGVLKQGVRTALIGAALAASLWPALATATAVNPLRDNFSSELTAAFLASYPAAGDMSVNINLPYGPDPRNTYDVYRPANASEAPLIVMIHGGGWNSGDKLDQDVAAAKAAYWVSRGYIFVAVNYRLGPDMDPLGQATDIASAIARIQAKAADWGGDREKMVLIGHGAGGHLAALLSANPAAAIYQGATPWKAGVILDAPAVDLTAIMESSPPENYVQAFGDDFTYWSDASPKNVLTSSGVPMLVVCSTRNPLASCSYAQAFRQQASDRGVSVEVLMKSLSPEETSSELGRDAAYTDDVDRFVRDAL